jgi:hypothetical protein
VRIWLGLAIYLYIVNGLMVGDLSFTSLNLSWGATDAQAVTLRLQAAHSLIATNQKMKPSPPLDRITVYRLSAHRTHWHGMHAFGGVVP